MKYYYRVRSEPLGRHIRCRVFSTTNPNGTWAKIGELVIDKDERQDFQEAFNADFIDEETQSP